MSEYERYQEWKSWEKSKFGRFTKDQSLYFQRELRACGVVLRSGLQVLEIGFGNGVFAGWAKDQGFDYLGLEGIEELVQIASSSGFSVNHSSNDLKEFVAGESQNVIVAFDVFEHIDISELELLLKKVRGWLRPNGLLIFRMPSGDSPFARALQYGDLTHKTVLGSSSVQQLALSCGYRLEQVRAPSIPLRGLNVYRFIRRAFVLLGQTVTTKLIRIFFHDNRRTVISANMLVTMRKV